MKNLKLKSIVFDREGCNTVIGKSNGKVISFDDPQNIILEMAELMDGEHSINDIYACLKTKGYEQDIYDLQNIIREVFIKEDLVLDKSTDFILEAQDLLKYDRILHFFASFDGVDYLQAQTMLKKLFQANILVLGVGGTGGHTAHSLISSGIRNMTLLDFDNVEVTNVTRQMLYTEKDIGYSKIEVAKKKLEEINKKANINIISKQIKTEKDITDVINQEKYDFIINTMDTPRGEIRYILDRAVYNMEIPYIYNGSTGSKVIVGPSIKKGVTPSYTELVPYKGIDLRISALNNENYITNVIEPMNGVVGQLTAYEVIKYITKCSSLSTWGKRIKLNMDVLEIDKYEY